MVVLVITLSLTMNIYLQSLKRSTFPISLCSPCIRFRSLSLSAPFTLTVLKALTARSQSAHSVFTKLSQCVHKALTVHSQSVHLALTVLSAFTYRSIRLYYIRADSNTYIKFNFLRLNFPDYWWNYCNDNSRGTPSKTSILGSHIIHRAFTTHFALMFCLFAVCICLPTSIQHVFFLLSECIHPSLTLQVG